MICQSAMWWNNSAALIISTVMGVYVGTMLAAEHASPGMRVTMLLASMLRAMLPATRLIGTWSLSSDAFISAPDAGI